MKWQNKSPETNKLNPELHLYWVKSSNSHFFSCILYNQYHGCSACNTVWRQAPASVIKKEDPVLPPSGRDPEEHVTRASFLTSDSRASHDQNKPTWRPTWVVFVDTGATFNPFPSALNCRQQLYLAVMNGVQRRARVVRSREFWRLCNEPWVKRGGHGGGGKQERSRFVYGASLSASEAISFREVVFVLVNILKHFFRI